MKFIKPVAYTILVLMWITIIGSTVFADSTQTNTSGSNTAIEGGYTSTSTTNFQDGSSSNTTSTTNNSSNSSIKSAPPTHSDFENVKIGMKFITHDGVNVPTSAGFAMVFSGDKKQIVEI